MHHYLVVYFYKKENIFKSQFGFGNAFISTVGTLENAAVVRSVEDELKKKNKVSGLCIINYFKASDIK